MTQHGCTARKPCGLYGSDAIDDAELFETFDAQLRSLNLILLANDKISMLVLPSHLICALRFQTTLVSAVLRVSRACSCLRRSDLSDEPDLSGFRTPARYDR